LTRHIEKFEMRLTESVQTDKDDIRSDRVLSV